MSHEARFRVAAVVTTLFLAGLVAAGLASRDTHRDAATATPRTERTTTHSSRPIRTQPAEVVYRPVSAPAPRWEDEGEHGRGRGRGRGGDEFELEEHEDD